MIRAARPMEQRDTLTPIPVFKPVERGEEEEGGGTVELVGLEAVVWGLLGDAVMVLEDVAAAEVGAAMVAVPGVVKTKG